MKAPLEKPVVKLVGKDSNAFFIIGIVKKALKQAGADQEYIEQYITEVTSGDYNNVLTCTLDYVDIQ